MNHKFKRLCTVGAASLIAAIVAPLVGATAAYAAGTLQVPGATMTTAGGAATFTSGNSATTFSLRLPAGAYCSLDSANSGYAWQTYMVPTTVDPTTLAFNSGGPSPQSTGTYATFRQPLWTTSGSQITDQQTAAAATPPGPGQVVSIPDMNFSGRPYNPGDVPAGTYNIGIACTAPGRVNSDRIWNTVITVKTDVAAGGPSQIDVINGTVPNAPTLNTLTSGDSQCVAAFTAGAAITNNTPTTSYTATATPGPVTVSGAASPLTIAGLTNGTTYTVTVHATNLAGNSGESTSLMCTPAPPAPTAVNATAGVSQGSETVTWTTPTGTAPTGYQVNLSPSSGTQTPPNPVAFGTNSVTFTNLAPGNYSVTVTALHSPGVNSAPSSPAVMFTILSTQTLEQSIQVVRPTGALVLTQVCGAFGPLPADPASADFAALPALTQVTPAAGAGAPQALTNPATGPRAFQPPYPDGLAGPATGTGSGPSVFGPLDPMFSGYPYPSASDGTSNATPVTYCSATTGGTNLGNAQYLGTGADRGKFYVATGRLNQVTVVDTRDTDVGWNIVGTMSRFYNQNNKARTFSGSQLGWEPVVNGFTPTYTDSDGNSYTQVVNPGPAVAPNTPNATGLSNGATLGNSPAQPGGSTCTGGPFPTPTVCTGGLGQAVLDARLKLLIPVTAISGTYNAVMTFSAI